MRGGQHIKASVAPLSGEADARYRRAGSSLPPRVSRPSMRMPPSTAILPRSNVRRIAAKESRQVQLKPIVWRAVSLNTEAAELGLDLPDPRR